MTTGGPRSGPGPLNPLWSCIFTKNVVCSTLMYIEDIIWDVFSKNLNLCDLFSVFLILGKTKKARDAILSNFPAVARPDLCSKAQW